MSRLLRESRHSRPSLVVSFIPSVCGFGRGLLPSDPQPVECRYRRSESNHDKLSAVHLDNQRACEHQAKKTEEPAEREPERIGGWLLFSQDRQCCCHRTVHKETRHSGEDCVPSKRCSHGEEIDGCCEDQDRDVRSPKYRV